MPDEKEEDRPHTVSEFLLRPRAAGQPRAPDPASPRTVEQLLNESLAASAVQRAIVKDQFWQALEKAFHELRGSLPQEGPASGPAGPSTPQLAAELAALRKELHALGQEQNRRATTILEDRLRAALMELAELKGEVRAQGQAKAQPQADASSLAAEVAELRKELRALGEEKARQATTALEDRLRSALMELAELKGEVKAQGQQHSRWVASELEDRLRAALREMADLRDRTDAPKRENELPAAETDSLRRGNLEAPGARSAPSAPPSKVEPAPAKLDPPRKPEAPRREPEPPAAEQRPVEASAHEPAPAPSSPAANLQRIPAHALYARAIEQLRLLNAESLESGLLAALRQTVQEILAMLRSGDQVLLMQIHCDTPDEPVCAHSVNVAILSLTVAAKMGWTDQQVLRLGLAALLHDMGGQRSYRVGMEPALSPADLEEANAAIEEAARRLAEVDDEKPSEPAEIIAQLHKTWPQRSSDLDRLAVSAQLIGLCDSFEALTHGRLSPQPISPHKAFERLFACKDRFDANLLKRLIENISPFPPGTLLRFGDEGLACVVGVSPGMLTRPVVQVWVNSDGAVNDPPVVTDLSREPLTRISTWTHMDRPQIASEAKKIVAYWLWKPAA